MDLREDRAVKPIERPARKSRSALRTLAVVRSGDRFTDLARIGYGVRRHSILLLEVKRTGPTLSNACHRYSREAVVRGT